MTLRMPPPCDWDLPDPAAAPQGREVVGVGADLEPGTLLAAYSRGLFPMRLVAEGPVAWWSPDPRGVLPLAALRVSSSLRRSCRAMSVTVDTDFAGVIRACGDPRRPDGWIDESFVTAYTRLHELGWAHSIETRDRDGRLVGGLYGVEIGGLFAGESMFHHVRDASKVALVALVQKLRAAGDPARVLDVQWSTPHLASLGVAEVARADYLASLPVALALGPVFDGPAAASGSRTTNA